MQQVSTSREVSFHPRMEKLARAARHVAGEIERQRRERAHLALLEARLAACVEDLSRAVGALEAAMRGERSAALGAPCAGPHTLAEHLCALDARMAAERAMLHGLESRRRQIERRLSALDERRAILARARLQCEARLAAPRPQRPFEPTRLTPGLHWA